MTAELIRDVLAWCSVINIAIFAAWGLAFIYAHDWLFNFHGRWFRLSVEKFDAIHYASMAFYELSIMLFNLIPYLVLRGLLS